MHTRCVGLPATQCDQRKGVEGRPTPYDKIIRKRSRERNDKARAPKKAKILDPDTMCGVQLADGALADGERCMPKLKACRLHNSTEKRAVQGRSQEYDVLMAIVKIQNPMYGKNRTPKARTKAEAEGTVSVRLAPFTDTSLRVGRARRQTVMGGTPISPRTEPGLGGDRVV